MPKQTDLCRIINCVCYNCPLIDTCETRKCPGRDERPYCEGFYVCSERGVDNIAHDFPGGKER